ncbi:MAG: aromatic ring-hydroxylating dioxygenase subunit alpha [Pseudomonadota bacterium]
MDQIRKRPDASQDNFTTDAAHAWTLPANRYTDPDVLREETRRIFHRSWIYVAPLAAFANPGDYTTQEIVDQRIFVIRTREGELKAFFNVCQHRGHSLLQGSGTAHMPIVCPYHAWAYDDEGALRAAPNCHAVADFDRADFSLPEVAVDTFAGFVFVNLDPHARPMAEIYPGAEERLREFCPQVDQLKPGREIPFDIAGNWKNVGDNLLECYHCSVAHKAFVDLVDMNTYQVELHDNWSLQWGECREQNIAYDFEGDAPGITQNVTLYLWPMVAFSLFPGMQGMATFAFLPLEAERTRQVYGYHTANDTLTETEEKALDYFGDVLGPEDVSLVEDVQRGLHSLGYHQGRFMIDAKRTSISEHAAHHFQSLVAKALDLG